MRQIWQFPAGLAYLLPMDGDWEPANVTLAVLAGGAGARMGRPKGELQIFGKPILHHLMQQFRWPGPTLLVTAPTRQHPPGSEKFDQEVIDPVFGQGPLRGILTALDCASSPVVIFATVDMPGLAQMHLYYLIDSLRQAQPAPGVMFQRFADDKPIVEPFPLGLHRSSRPIVAERLSVGGSVRSLLDAGFAMIASPADWPADVWINLNRPQDLNALPERMP